RGAKRRAGRLRLRLGTVGLADAKTCHCPQPSPARLPLPPPILLRRSDQKAVVLAQASRGGGAPRRSQKRKRHEERRGAKRRAGRLRLRLGTVGLADAKTCHCP